MEGSITRRDIILATEGMSRDAVAETLLPFVKAVNKHMNVPGCSLLAGRAGAYIAEVERAVRDGDDPADPCDDFPDDAIGLAPSRWACLAAEFLFDFLAYGGRSDLDICLEALEVSVPDEEQRGLLADIHAALVAAGAAKGGTNA